MHLIERKPCESCEEMIDITDRGEEFGHADGCMRIIDEIHDAPAAIPAVPAVPDMPTPPWFPARQPITAADRSESDEKNS